MTISHTDARSFKDDVLESEVPVLVDFFATWCGPCKMLGPVMEDIAKERSDIKVVKVDIDKDPDLATQYDVMSVPTVILFKDGKNVHQAVGFRPKDSLLAEFSL